MPDYLHSETIGGVYFRVEYGTSDIALNPRKDYDHAFKMICIHGRYNLGDDHDYTNAYEAVQDITGRGDELDCTDEEMTGALNNANILWLPLYLYDHSGITMSTTGFSCPWDSGQVGIIYITREAAEKEWPRITNKETGKLETNDEWVARVYEYARGEVAEYDAYISGEVYVTTFWKELPNSEDEADYDDEEPLEVYGGWLGRLGQCIEEARLEAKGLAE